MTPRPQHLLAELGGATDPSKALIFVRGFQGYNYLSGQSVHQGRWFRALRSREYTGRLFSFRWFSPPIDCFKWNRDARVPEAADALCELLSSSRQILPIRTSFVGFSMGGWILQRALRTARRHGVRVNRVYLFGAAAPRNARWPELLQMIKGGLWNFHSTKDDVLQKHYPNAVGLYGLPAYYNGATNVDCTSLVNGHEWVKRVNACFDRARLSGRNL